MDSDARDLDEFVAEKEGSNGMIDYLSVALYAKEVPTYSVPSIELDSHPVPTVAAPSMSSLVSAFYHTTEEPVSPPIPKTRGKKRITSMTLKRPPKKARMSFP